MLTNCKSLPFRLYANSCPGFAVYKDTNPIATVVHKNWILNVKFDVTVGDNNMCAAVDVQGDDGKSIRNLIYCGKAGSIPNPVSLDP